MYVKCSTYYLNTHIAIELTFLVLVTLFLVYFQMNLIIKVPIQDINIMNVSNKSLKHQCYTQNLNLFVSLLLEKKHKEPFF